MCSHHISSINRKGKHRSLTNPEGLNVYRTGNDEKNLTQEELYIDIILNGKYGYKNVRFLRNRRHHLQLVPISVGCLRHPGPENRMHSTHNFFCRKWKHCHKPGGFAFL